MKKRGLSSIQRPVVTDDMISKYGKSHGKFYFRTSQRVDINGRDILIMNYYSVNNGDIEPVIRTFCEKDDYITQDLHEEKTKWKTGSVDNLLPFWAFSGHRDVLFDDGSNIAEEWFKEKRPDIKPDIISFCDEIKKERLAVKHKAIFDEIDRNMSRFGDVPDDYDVFVKEKVFHEDNYIFYSKSDMKAYCSKCESDFDLNKKDLKNLKHNMIYECPCCGYSFLAKSRGIPRGKLKHVRWSLLIQPDDEDVLVRYFVHEKDFRDNYRSPKISTFEDIRSIHTPHEIKEYMKRPYLGRYGNWGPYRDPSGWFYNEYNHPKDLTLYWKRVDLKGTYYEYSGINEYIESKNGDISDAPWCLDNWLQLYRKHHYVEKIVKVGFNKIIRELMDYYRNVVDDLEFSEGRNIYEVMGINREQYKKLREIGDPTSVQFLIVKHISNISNEDIEFIAKHSNGAITYKSFASVLEHTSVTKLRNYFNKKNINIRDYFDYIRWLEYLEYNMDDSYYLFPKDFTKAHDRTLVEYRKMISEREKEAQKQFDKMIKEMKKSSFDIAPFKLKDNGLMIKVPDGITELKKEGEVLHHCVGTYADRVAKGETIILFIRKENAPETPYFTMEWKGKIIQCRGFRNCSPPLSVRKFEDKFVNAMNEYNLSISKKAANF